MAVTVTLLTAGLVELLLRLVVPVPDPYERFKWREEDVRPQYVVSQFDPNLRVTFIAEDGLPGMHGWTSFSTNNAGFRGEPLRVPKPPDEYRVFMVGGSTTECLVLDDHDALTAVLQRELQKRFPAGRTIRVYGAGKSGDRTDDHLAMIVHRLVHLEPDMVIVFPGVNDLRAAIAGFDFRHYGYDIGDGREPPLQDYGPPQRLGFWGLIRMSAYEFQIGRRLHALAHGKPMHRNAGEVSPRTLEDTVRTGARLKRPLVTDIQLRVRINRTAEPTDASPRTDLRSYRTNLRSLAAAVEGHGARLVFVSQQTTWNSATDPEVRRWQWMNVVSRRAYRVDLLNRAMEAYNDVLREVARERSIPLYDPAREVPKSLEFFYDDVHFNVAGARRVGEGLASVIATARLVP